MKIIGHRGAMAVAPENTRQSFQVALDAGVDMIEFDVRVTCDNIAVIWHEKAIVYQSKRLRIADHTYDELHAAMPELLTLSETLELMAAKITPMIEIKAGAPVQPIIEVLREYTGRMYEANELLVTSYSFSILRQIRAKLPGVPVGIIHDWSGIIATHRARVLGTRTIVMDHRFLWSGFIRMISKDYELHTFTLNDPEKAERWANAGLSGVVTNDPALFVTQRQKSNLSVKS